MITKAEVLSVVNARLARGETSIDIELRNILYDISTRENFLGKEATRDTVVDQYVYSLPDNFKDMNTLRLNDTALLKRITFENLQKTYIDITSSGEPEYYALKNNYLWLDIKPNAVFTMRLWYSIYHPDDVESIEFAEQFREAINEGVIMKICEKYEDWEGVKGHLPLYEREIQKRIDSVERTMYFQKYNDI